MILPPWPSRKSMAFLLPVGMGILAGCIFVYLKAVKFPKELDLAALCCSVPKLPEENPDPIHLNTLAASEEVRSHLLAGDFKIAHRMQDIPANCTANLDSSFVNNSGAVRNGGRVDFADPGQPAQYGDTLIPDAPFRQLVFAGVGSRSCFVYFQHDEINRVTYCLAVMDISTRKALYVGETENKVTSLDELRSLVYKHQLADNSGPAC